MVLDSAFESRPALAARRAKASEGVFPARLESAGARWSCIFTSGAFRAWRTRLSRRSFIAGHSALARDILSLELRGALGASRPGRAGGSAVPFVAALRARLVEIAARPRLFAPKRVEAAAVTAIGGRLLSLDDDALHRHGAPLAVGGDGAFYARARTFSAA